MATAKIETNTSNLATALAAFQADLPAVTEDGNNPHFKSKYATLGNMSSVVLPKLSAHGLAFSTGSRVADGSLILNAKLLHVSGEFESMEFPIAETNPQKIGSAVTYFRRYALAALTGVVADADDDGNAASTVSGTERTIEKAKASAAVADDPLSKAKAAIQEWIGGDEAKRTQANAAQARLKADGLTGVALLEGILAEVKK